METIVTIIPIKEVWEQCKFRVDYGQLSVFGCSIEQVAQLLEEAVVFNRVNQNRININVQVIKIDECTFKVTEE